MSTIVISIPSEIAVFLGDTPEQIERTALEILVLDLHRRCVISGGRATEILAMERLDFTRLAGENGIPYFRMSPEGWQHEVESIRKP